MLESLQVQPQIPRVPSLVDTEERGFLSKMGALGATKTLWMGKEIASQRERNQVHFGSNKSKMNPAEEEEECPVVSADWDDQNDDDFLSMPPPPPPTLVRENAVMSLEELELEMPKGSGPIFGFKADSRARAGRRHPYHRQHSAIWSTCVHQVSPN